MTWFRSPPGRAFLGILAVYAVMFALVIALRVSDYRLTLPARLAVAIGIAIPAGYYLIRYWHSLDEAAREAQKWAWFWGGSAGMAVGFLVTAIRPLGLSTLFEGASPSKLMAYGGITVMLCQLAGFTVAWAYWWMSRR